MNKLVFKCFLLWLLALSAKGFSYIQYPIDGGSTTENQTLYFVPTAPMSGTLTLNSVVMSPGLNCSWDAAGRTATMFGTSTVGITMPRTITGTKPSTPEGFFNATIEVNYTFGGQTRTTTFNLGQMTLGATGGANHNFVFEPTFSISASPADPPSGKLTIIADTLAAGSNRFYNLNDGPKIPYFLVAGSNVVIDTDNPSSIPAGPVNVFQGPFVIGTGTIVKDSNGNFDTTVNAVGAAVIARIRIYGRDYVSGSGELLVQGQPAVTFPFTGVNGLVFTQTYGAPTDVATGAEITVSHINNAGEKTVLGTSSIVRDEFGGFDISVQCDGPGDEPGPASGEAVFELDAVSYDPGAKSVVLVIDGQTYVASPSGMGGSPSKGVRQKYTVRIDNSDGRLNGKAYSWKVTGTIGDKPVAGLTIASGTAPVWMGKQIPGDPPTPDYSFLTNASATVGSPSTSPDAETEYPPENDYDPNAPIDPESPTAPQQQAKKDQYESVNKAVKDAIGGPGTGDGTVPGPGLQDSEGKTVGAASGAAIDSATEQAGQIGRSLLKPNVATWSGSTSSLVLTMPRFGAVTMEFSIYQPWLGVVRSCLLGYLSFLSVMGGLRIMRNAVA